MEVVIISVLSKLYLNVQSRNDDIITAVQNDSKTRFLDIVLLNGSIPLNLANTTIRLYAQKPDGTEIYNDAIIRDENNGRIEVEMTNQLLAKVGVINAQIVIIKNNIEILSTFPFQINVIQSLLSSSAVESTNEYGSLVILFQDLMKAKEQIQLLITKLGSPTGAIASNNITTVFDALNFMVNYLQSNSVAPVVSTVNAIKTKTDLLTNSSYGLSALQTRLSNLSNITKGDMIGRQLKKAEVTQTKQAGVAETERTLLTLSNALIVGGSAYAIDPTASEVYRNVSMPLKITIDNNTIESTSQRIGYTLQDMIAYKVITLPLGGNSIQIKSLPNTTSTSVYTSKTIQYKLTVYYYTLN